MQTDHAPRAGGELNARHLFARSAERFPVRLGQRIADLQSAVSLGSQPYRAALLARKQPVDDERDAGVDVRQSRKKTLIVDSKSAQGDRAEHRVNGRHLDEESHLLRAALD